MNETISREQLEASTRESMEALHRDLQSFRKENGIKGIAGLRLQHTEAVLKTLSLHIGRDAHNAAEAALRLQNSLQRLTLGAQNGLYTLDGMDSLLTRLKFVADPKSLSGAADSALPETEPKVSGMTDDNEPLSGGTPSDEERNDQLFVDAIARALADVETPETTVGGNHIVPEGQPDYFVRDIDLFEGTPHILQDTTLYGVAADSAARMKNAAQWAIYAIDRLNYPEYGKLQSLRGQLVDAVGSGDFDPAAHETEGRVAAAFTEQMRPLALLLEGTASEISSFSQGLRHSEYAPGRIMSMLVQPEKTQAPRIFLDPQPLMSDLARAHDNINAGVESYNRVVNARAEHDYILRYEQHIDGQAEMAAIFLKGMTDDETVHQKIDETLAALNDVALTSLAAGLNAIGHMPDALRERLAPAALTAVLARPADPSAFYLDAQEKAGADAALDNAGLQTWLSGLDHFQFSHLLALGHKTLANPYLLEPSDAAVADIDIPLAPEELLESGELLEAAGAAALAPRETEPQEAENDGASAFASSPLQVALLDIIAERTAAVARKRGQAIDADAPVESLLLDLSQADEAELHNLHILNRNLLMDVGVELPRVMSRELSADELARRKAERDAAIAGVQSAFAELDKNGFFETTAAAYPALRGAILETPVMQVKLGDGAAPQATAEPALEQTAEPQRTPADEMQALYHSLGSVMGNPAPALHAISRALGRESADALHATLTAVPESPAGAPVYSRLQRLSRLMNMSGRYNFDSERNFHAYRKDLKTGFEQVVTPFEQACRDAEEALQKRYREEIDARNAARAKDPAGEDTPEKQNAFSYKMQAIEDDINLLASTADTLGTARGHLEDFYAAQARNSSAFQQAQNRVVSSLDQLVQKRAKELREGKAYETMTNALLEDISMRPDALAILEGIDKSSRGWWWPKSMKTMVDAIIDKQNIQAEIAELEAAHPGLRAPAASPEYVEAYAKAGKQLSGLVAERTDTYAVLDECYATLGKTGQAILAKRFNAQQKAKKKLEPTLKPAATSAEAAPVASAADAPAEPAADTKTGEKLPPEFLREEIAAKQAAAAAAAASAPELRADPSLRLDRSAQAPAEDVVEKPARKPSRLEEYLAAHKKGDTFSAEKAMGGTPIGSGDAKGREWAARVNSGLLARSGGMAAAFGRGLLAIGRNALTQANENKYIIVAAAASGFAVRGAAEFAGYGARIIGWPAALVGGAVVGIIGGAIRYEYNVIRKDQPELSRLRASIKAMRGFRELFGAQHWRALGRGLKLIPASYARARSEVRTLRETMPEIYNEESWLKRRTMVLARTASIIAATDDPRAKTLLQGVIGGMLGGVIGFEIGKATQHLTQPYFDAAFAKLGAMFNGLPGFTQGDVNAVPTLRDPAEFPRGSSQPLPAMTADEFLRRMGITDADKAPLGSSAFRRWLELRQPAPTIEEIMRDAARRPTAGPLRVGATLPVLYPELVNPEGGVTVVERTVVEPRRVGTTVIRPEETTVPRDPVLDATSNTGRVSALVANNPAFAALEAEVARLRTAGVLRGANLRTFETLITRSKAGSFTALNDLRAFIGNGGTFRGNDLTRIPGMQAKPELARAMMESIQSRLNADMFTDQGFKDALAMNNRHLAELTQPAAVARPVAEVRPEAERVTPRIRPAAADITPVAVGIRQIGEELVAKGHTVEVRNGVLFVSARPQVYRAPAPEFASNPVGAIEHGLRDAFRGFTATRPQMVELVTPAGSDTVVGVVRIAQRSLFQIGHTPDQVNELVRQVNAGNRDALARLYHRTEAALRVEHGGRTTAADRRLLSALRREAGLTQAELRRNLMGAPAVRPS